MERRLHSLRRRHLLPVVGAPQHSTPRNSSACAALLHLHIAHALPPPLAHRLDADHPDKDGLQLRKIAKVLKLFDKEAKEEYGAGCKVGVFLDYVSMPQRSRGSPEDDRTPEELATFKRSLQVRRRPAALPHRPPPTPRAACPPLPGHQFVVCPR